MATGRQRFAACLLCALWVVSVGGSAHAEDSRGSVVVYVEGTPVDGVSPDDVRSEIVSLLPQDTKVADPEAFKRALRYQGMRWQLGNVIAVKGGRTLVVKVLRRAMQRVDADVAIISRIRRSRGLEPEVYLLVLREGVNDPRVDEAVPFHAADPVERLAALQRALQPVLSELVPDMELPERARPDPVDPELEEEVVVAEPVPEPPPAEAGMSIVSVEAAYRVAGRRFGYSEPRTLNLRPFSFFGAHEVAAAAEAFPFPNVPVAEHIGLAASFNYAILQKTELPDGRSMTNNFHALKVGLRLRFRTGDPPAPLIYLQGSFGWQRFSFARAENPYFDELPDVWYVYGAGGFDIRVPIGPVSLLAGADYAGPWSAGQLGSRFERAHIHGLMARAGVAVQFVEFLEARALADATIMFYDLDSQPLDAYVAGSARDEFLAAHLGLAYLFH